MNNNNNEIDIDFIKLKNWFKNHGKDEGVIVALSGGVDSAVVALAAKQSLDDKAFAVTANYEALAYEELLSAKKIAKEISIKHEIIKYNELDEKFTSNDKLRCYYCRSKLAFNLRTYSEKVGVNLIVDGTHLDDLSDYRPGMKALEENGIRSPLLELKIGKRTIRDIAQKHKISIYDKPSNSCLASRIPMGTIITQDKLKRIERSEEIFKEIFNIRQVRIRDHENIARIEIEKKDFMNFFDIDKIEFLTSEIKKLGYSFVTLDLVGYKQENLKIIKTE